VTASRALIDVEVLHHQLQAIAEEMGVALMRAAFSPNIKERRDHSCAVFDARGELLAQAAHIPVHLGSMPMSVRAAIDSGLMAGGAEVMLNDPYAGGTHLPDLTLVAPVTIAPSRPGAGGAEVVCYVANRAHHADVGGSVPGSLPIGTHIDGEGVRLGPTVVSEASVAAFAGASRTPEERHGDLAAQRAANQVGVARMRALVDRLGAATLAARAEALLAHGAALMESVIEGLPDGDYEARDVLDGDGFEARAIPLVVRLTVAGRRCTFDLRDSADQVPGPVNAVRAITLSAVLYAMRCLGPEGMPTNAGCLRPIEVLTRPGSVLDAVSPAPVAVGNVETSQRLVDLLFAALARAAPGRIPAASCGSMSNVCLGSEGGGAGAFVYYETIGGGAGAGPGWRGADGVHVHMTNTLNTPVEAFEHAYPMRVRRYELRSGSGGAGRWRGGEGIVREYEVLAPTVATVLCERQESRPWGLAGGGEGAAGRSLRVGRDGTEEALPAKVTRHLEAGERLRIETPGGGGYGSAAEVDESVAECDQDARRG
jgi:N-methylhydantoinase B